MAARTTPWVLGKLYDALRVLAGPGSLNERLASTHLPLVQARGLEKDPEVQERLQKILGDLASKPNRGHGSAVESVRGMRAKQAQPLAERILELYMFASGAAPPQGRSDW
jgi:hypothetical protein